VNCCLASFARAYEVRPHSDKRGFDLISDELPFGRLWYGEPNAMSNAIGYAKFRSRSHDAVIRVYDEAGKEIETHEHAAISKSGGFNRVWHLEPNKKPPRGKA
jgi:hypothetical protein